jgi:hypothetical protein
MTAIQGSLRDAFICPRTLAQRYVEEGLRMDEHPLIRFADGRILFVFDPWRSAILLVAGDKSGKWNRWYAEAIPHAEQLYEIYLKERAEEETGR